MISTIASISKLQDLIKHDLRFNNITFTELLKTELLVTYLLEVILESRYSQFSIILTAWRVLNIKSHLSER